MAIPKTPPGLSRAAAKLWKDVCTTYKIDADGLTTLEMACRSRDRWRAAEEILTKEGILSTGSKGQPVVHPAVLIVDRERRGYLSAIRLLGLEGEV